MSDPVHEAICKAPNGTIICQQCGHVHEIKKPDLADIERLVGELMRLSGDMIWLDVKMMEREYSDVKEQRDEVRAALMKAIGGE